MGSNYKKMLINKSLQSVKPYNPKKRFLGNHTFGLNRKTELSENESVYKYINQLSELAKKKKITSSEYEYLIKLVLANYFQENFSYAENQLYDQLNHYIHTLESHINHFDRMSE